MNRHIFLPVLISFLANLAWAQADDRAGRVNPNSTSALLGYNAGGFNFGATFEHMMDSASGIGGQLRIFNKEDSGTNQTNGYLIFGGTFGYHFYKKNWDLSFTPSMNFINIDAATTNPDDATAIGPGLSIALLCNLTDNFALGFDNSRYWVWFNDDYAGLRIDDLAIKGRFSF